MIYEERLSQEIDVTSAESSSLRWSEALLQFMKEHESLQEKILDYLDNLLSQEEENLLFRELGFEVETPKRSFRSISKRIIEWAALGYTIDQMAEGAALLGSQHPYQLVRTVLRNERRKDEKRGKVAEN